MSKRKALTDLELELEINLDDVSSGPEDFSSDDSVADPLYNAETTSDHDSSSEESVGELIRRDREEEEAEWEDEDEAEFEAEAELEANGNPIAENSPTWTDYVGRQKYFAFTGRSGLQKDIPKDITPLEVFKLLVDEDVIRLIVEETNRFAEQSLSSRKGKFSRFKKWTRTNPEEIQKFLGLTIWMGLVKLSSLPDYWAYDGIYKQHIPPSIMSRNRFQMLLSMLHFRNNESIQKGDRLAKIQPLLTLLEKKFQQLYFPDQDIVIDETLVPWRGRLIFRQYIPNKCHRYGVKLFKLCSTDGYTWAMKIYAGKSQDGQREVGLATNICMELCRPLLNDGRTLFIDNFYTSYELAKLMLENSTHVVGTLRSNKKHFPKEVMLTKLKRGDIVSREDENGIVVLKWRDTRDVRMLSTKHAPIMIDVQPKSKPRLRTADTEEPQPSTSRDLCSSPKPSTSRDLARLSSKSPQPSTSRDDNTSQVSASPSQNSNATTSAENEDQTIIDVPGTKGKNKTRKKRKATTKPLAILAYNKGKGGIDLSDQMTSYVSSLRKGIKWYRKLAMELLLGMAIVNSWVIYKKVCQKKISIRTFREKLAEQLLGIEGRKRRKVEKNKSGNAHLLKTRMNDQGKKIRRCCSVCYAKLKDSKGRKVAKNQSKMVYTYCDKCPDEPQLCLDCFNLNHQ